LQSVATLLTRRYAGQLCDLRGARRTTMLGFASASGAAALYLLSYACAQYHGAALALLGLGRLFLGLGESLFITALSAWSIERVGQQHAGRAMAWCGIAMYGAIAAGAPIGLWLVSIGGFPLVAGSALLAPLLAALLAWRWPDAKPRAQTEASFFRIVRKIWAPGLSMALASSGVGTISSFLSLRYEMNAWSGTAWALTGFGVAYIAMRVFFAGVPDRLGGFRTGAISLSVEAVGLFLIGSASTPVLALLGAVLTGAGYSLVFPSLGVEALKRVVGENRGLVLGAYLASFDLGLALAGPSAGAVARSYGLNAAFFVAAAASICALALLLADRLSLFKRADQAIR
jgi:predicted MFS family arabinose efflux permease